MMIQKLPLELVTLIASYLDFNSIQEFATTCHKSYFGVLPVIWDQLTIADTNELLIISKRLQVNSIWNQRAIQFVRKVSLSHKEVGKKYSCNLAASMFGITCTELDQLSEREDYTEPHEQIKSFGDHLLNLFPHMNNLVFDYGVALQNFYLQEGTKELSYFGSFSIINFESDNARNLHYLLVPFKKISHFKLKTIPVVSLCEDIDESILTNEDIYEIAKSGFDKVEKLELSYLDSSIEVNLFIKLLQSLPSLSCLLLEWIFPPMKDDYTKLCQIIDQYALLYPSHIEKKSNILQVTFSYKNMNLN